MDYRILGPAEVIDGDRPVELGGPLERALLARLLLGAGRVVSLERLIEDIWPGEPPESAVNSVRVRISHLRKALAIGGEDGAIRTRQPGYLLVLRPEDTLDVTTFEELTERGRAALRTGDFETAARVLREALALWRGPALADVGEAPFARSEAARLEQGGLAALQDRIDADLALGRHSGLVGELESLCAQHPLRERFWAQRMVALYRSGRQADALATFQKLRRTLSEDLGLDPSPELSALESQILAQAPELAGPVPVSPVRTQAHEDSLPTGVVTYLLTDIAGSSELWEQDPEAMSSALQRHEEVIAEAVRSHDGRLIKSKGEGDSTLSVFRRVTAATAAALDLTKALAGEQWAGGIELRVRIALHTGEAHEREGDYFGPALNRAARMRALASGGQIVLSGVTAELAREQLPEGAALTDLGEHQLRGLARSERVFELAPPGVQVVAPEPVRPQFPETLGLTESGPFVGRVGELERLTALWKECAIGATRAVFIAGEPGIGKTRLVTELSRALFDEGAVVLYGRTDEDGLLPLQPFVESLRQYVSSLSPQACAALPRTADLAHLLPEIAPVQTRAHPVEDPEVARYRLFEAVAAVLANAAQAGPVMLILDDLHWADRPTLMLLHHLLRVGGRTPVLIIGTYRESELARTRPLAELLADLRRERALERVPLRGLVENDAVAYFERMTAQDIGRRGRDLARVIVETAEGNPFFMEQIIGHLIESGGLTESDGQWVLKRRVEDLGIPEGVVEAIGRRLSRLSEACNRALAAASVLGRDFEVDAVTKMTKDDAEAVLAGIEEAIRAGLVRELPQRARAACTFSHALVQQVLYEELSLARKQRLHLKAAEAIESTRTAGPAQQVAAVAGHLQAAGAAADPEKTIDYSIRAMEAARRIFAFEEAIEHAKAALELMVDADAEPDRYARLLERIGDLTYVAGVDPEPSIKFFQEAAGLLETAGDHHRLANIHLKIARGRTTLIGGIDIPQALDHLAVAGRLLDPAPDRQLEAKLLLGIGVASVFALDLDEGMRATERARELAESLGSDLLLGSALWQHGWTLFCRGRLDEAVSSVEQAWQIGDRLDHGSVAFPAAWCAGLCTIRRDPVEGYDFLRREIDKPRQAQARSSRETLALVARDGLVLGGDLRAAREIEETELPSGMPHHLLLGTGFRKFIEGEWELAARQTREAGDECRRRGNALVLAGTLRDLGVYQTHLGDIVAARRSFEELVEMISQSGLYLVELLARSQFALLEIDAGDLKAARSHHARSEQILALGNGWCGMADATAVVRGLIATADGRLGDAESSFEEAIDVTTRYHLPFQQAEATYQWGRALLAAGDPTRALEKFDAATDIYRTRGAGEPFIERVLADRQRAV